MRKKLDNMGRIVIPAEMRKELGINEDVNVEVRNKQIIITNTKQIRTKEEIQNMLKTIKGNTDEERAMRYALEWVLKEE